MRRCNRGPCAAVAGAFALGLLLVLTCSFRLALLFAALLLLVLGASVLKG